MVFGSGLRICRMVPGVEKVPSLPPPPRRQISPLRCAGVVGLWIANTYSQFFFFHSTVTQIKQTLIHKAKVKKAYAKVKARELNPDSSKPRTIAAGSHVTSDVEESDLGQSKGGPGCDDQDGDDDAHTQEARSQDMHPARHLMLQDEEKAQAGAESADGVQTSSDGRRRRSRRPGYYDKQLKKADQKRAEAEQRALEMQRRREEREKKLAERDRFRKAMAKTRGPDGRKKLGRESTLLLDKVKKLVAEGQTT